MSLRRSRRSALDEHDEVGWRRLVVHGDLDFGATPKLRRALIASVTYGTCDVLVDLSDVDSLGWGGLQVLLLGQRLLAHGDRALVIVCPWGAVRRAFDTAVPAHTFALYETLGPPPVGRPAL